MIKFYETKIYFQYTWFVGYEYNESVHVHG